jgi:transcriptional regulator with XRE-family HTH domain
MKEHPLNTYKKENKLTIAQLAFKLNLSPRTLDYYLAFKKYPSRNTAQKISKLTGIPVIDLLYPEERNGNS